MYLGPILDSIIGNIVLPISGGGGSIQTPLRTVSQSNRIFSAMDPNATRDSVAFRTPYLITNTKDLIFSISNWVISSGGLTNTPDLTVVEASVECNGVVVPLRWGGNRTKLFLSGDNDIQSDPLYPADFGLAGSSFPMGLTVWLKGILRVPTIALSVPVNHHRSAGEQAGCQFGWFLTGSTTLSSTDVTGAYTVNSGASLYGRSYMFSPLLLGHPVVDGISVGISGDSIGGGLTDSAGAIGGGFFQRAAYGNGTSDIIPVLNFSIGGTNSTNFIDVAKVISLYKYAKYWGYQHAANEINGTTTLTQQQDRFNALTANFTTGGAQKLFAIPPFARTSSTDSFATVANQSYANVGWQPGGVADTFEAWEYSLVGNYIHAVWPTLAARDATETRKWKADGVAQKWTQDGLHARTQANIDVAAVHYNLMRSW